MLSREDLVNRLNHLAPGSKYAFWLDEPHIDNKGYNNVVKLLGYCLTWYPENSVLMPTLQDIMNVDSQAMNQAIENKRKSHRDKEKVNDLAIIAGFEMEKKSNPTLVFSAYLDDLELKSKQEKDKMEDK